MMDMSGNSPASFWGARHPSWSSSNHGSGHTGANSTTAATGGSSGANHSDPKMAEKLMTELQVSEFKVRL